MAVQERSFTKLHSGLTSAWGASGIGFALILLPNSIRALGQERTLKDLPSYLLVSKKHKQTNSYR